MVFTVSRVFQFENIGNLRQTNSKLKLRADSRSSPSRSFRKPKCGEKTARIAKNFQIKKRIHGEKTFSDWLDGKSFLLIGSL